MSERTEPVRESDGVAAVVVTATFKGGDASDRAAKVEKYAERHGGACFVEEVVVDTRLDRGV